MVQEPARQVPSAAEATDSAGGRRIGFQLHVIVGDQRSGAGEGEAHPEASSVHVEIANFRCRPSFRCGIRCIGAAADVNVDAGRRSSQLVAGRVPEFGAEFESAADHLRQSDADGSSAPIRRIHCCRIGFRRPVHMHVAVSVPPGVPLPAERRPRHPLRRTAGGCQPRLRRQLHRQQQRQRQLLPALHQSSTQVIICISNFICINKPRNCGYSARISL